MQEKTKEGKKDKRKVKLQLGKDDNKQIIMYAVEVSLDRYFAFNHQSVQLESRGGISRTRRAKGNGGKIILSPLINRDSSSVGRDENSPRYLVMIHCYLGDRWGTESCPSSNDYR